MSKKIVIVGGVAGGATAAARLRRLDERSKIVMLERGPHISFANCGLPYYVGGVIKKKEKLLVQTVQGMAARFNIDIRTKNEVTAIHRESKTIEVKNLETGATYQEEYDYLVLSPGAEPIMPQIEGVAGNPRVFTLRTIPHAEAIVDFIREHKPQTAVVVGGGFIGLEMAENLKARNLKVILVEALNQVQPSLDYEMACIIHAHLRDKGLELILEDTVTKLDGSKVMLKSGRIIQSDMVVMAIGVRPESKLAEQAGLELGLKGAIRVNEYLQTSDPNIYALGDAIEVKHYISGQPVYIPLAWPANRQGRMVADNIYGAQKTYKGTIGTSVAKVFDLTVASTGLNEKNLKQQGIDYKVVHVHPNSHAGYYPGAMPLDMKMLFQENGRILGAQVVGYKGVEKRIDVLATAIKGNLTVYDLQDLELAYAPPYSSGKDPVNILGYAAANILDHMVDTVQYYEIHDLLAEGNILVDVSQPEEVELGKIEGSINIPLPELRSRLNELPKNRTIYVTCRVGLRGYIACRILTQHGFKAANLDGGYRTYASVYGNPESRNLELNQPLYDTGRVHTAGPIGSLTAEKIIAHRQVDATCLQCPGPIKLVSENLKLMDEGQIMEVAVTDPGFARDIKVWCDKTGNTLLKTEKEGDTLKAYIRKG